MSSDACLGWTTVHQKLVQFLDKLLNVKDIFGVFHVLFYKLVGISYIQYSPAVKELDVSYNRLPPAAICANLATRLVWPRTAARNHCNVLIVNRGNVAQEQFSSLKVTKHNGDSSCFFAFLIGEVLGCGEFLVARQRAQIKCSWVLICANPC